MKTLRHVGIGVMMLASLLMLVSVFGTTALAETYGGLTYTVEDGKITITDCIDTQM